MLFSYDLLLRAAVILLAVCGFFVARYIRNHKTKNTPMTCPVGFDCHSVVHSDYSKFFGVPVELAGMIYYAFIAISYLLLFFLALNAIPLTEVVPFLCFIFFSSLFATAFSLYLIYVQIFILKKGCSWCIVSAGISVLIFVSLFL